jgi:hypothetical protein
LTLKDVLVVPDAVQGAGAVPTGQGVPGCKRIAAALIVPTGKRVNAAKGRNFQKRVIIYLRDDLVLRKECKARY